MNASLGGASRGAMLNSPVEQAAHSNPLISRKTLASLTNQMNWRLGEERADEIQQLVESYTYRAAYVKLCISCLYASQPVALLHRKTCEACVEQRLCAITDAVRDISADLGEGETLVFRPPQAGPLPAPEQASGPKVFHKFRRLAGNAAQKAMALAARQTSRI